jgi:quercetin dioxygenase-like cupin family protein
MAPSGTSEIEMKILHQGDVARAPVDPSNFSGPGWMQRAGGYDDEPGIKLFRVHFEPGTRTHWHVHSGPQLLHVIEGRCLVQRKGGPVEVLETGDVAIVEPGEVHWHGADPSGPMTHLAVNVASETTWLGPGDDGPADA